MRGASARRERSYAVDVPTVVREVGPYEVASSLVAWPACAHCAPRSTSRRLTLAREGRTCVVASLSSALFFLLARSAESRRRRSLSVVHVFRPKIDDSVARTP